MASLTRSTRRAEGLHHGRGPPADDGRQKRRLDLPDRELDPLRSKRARIAIGILARADDARPRPSRPPPRRHPALAGTSGNGGNGGGGGGGGSGGSANAKQLPKASATDLPPAEINGVDHENELQPEPPAAKKQGRKLRSQEATRFKSELSAYFQDYDEVIGNDPKEQHLFTLDTPIVVVDSHRRDVPPDAPRVAPDSHPPADVGVKAYGDALYTDVFDSQRIDFGFLETQQNSQNLDDPLPDSLFEPVHKKAERMERSIRNSEKGRAQHERDQIIRLLEGLQGHDWLRVMGVSGVTETRKKTFEPARAHFIKGCQTILDKFRNWTLEEKRRKQEKERALADKGDDAQGPEQDAQNVDDMSTSSREQGSATSSPAQQLRQEAMARSQMAATAGSKRPRPPARPPAPRAFKSFFSKKHERDGAVNRNRRTGRKVLAWGHALPDMAEADFCLPEEYRDEDTLKARARKKRRDKRGKRP